MIVVVMIKLLCVRYAMCSVGGLDLVGEGLDLLLEVL